MSDVVAITSIAAGGEGVGRLADGRAVFVARTAPGERIRLREGVKLHKSFARGELGEIVAAGAVRVTAPCPHYVQDHCGGCQLQHVTYEAQLAAKRAIVGTRCGGLPSSTSATPRSSRRSRNGATGRKSPWR